MKLVHVTCQLSMQLTALLLQALALPSSTEKALQ